MTKLSNFFDFAKKELTQDGFLLWLFDNNGRDEGISSAVHALLFLFLKEKCPLDTSQISFTTRAQYYGIDVVLIFSMNNEEYIIAIEDKTNSFLNNGLEYYAETVHKKYPSTQRFCNVVFQTDYMIQRDRDEAKRSGWLSFDIFDIDQAFSSVSTNADNDEILSSFIAHIHKKRVALEQGKEDVRQWYRLDSRWKVLFDQIPKGPESEIEIFGNNRFRFRFYYSLIEHNDIDLQFSTYQHGREFTCAVRIRENEFTDKQLLRIENRFRRFAKWENCRVSKQRGHRLICTFLFSESKGCPISSDSLLTQLGSFQKKVESMVEKYRLHYSSNLLF